MLPNVPPLGPPERKDIYAVFCGSIDQSSVQKLFTSIAPSTLPSNNIGTFHLLFQSTGGTVADGVCLYNFFKSLPVDLALYNVGAVWSAAAIAFLGANKRRTSARASFMIHRTHVSAQFAKAPQLKSFTNGIVIDDARTESILREYLTLPDWDELDKYDLFFSGKEAVDVGLANEIYEFAPPSGAQLFNI